MAHSPEAVGQLQRAHETIKRSLSEVELSVRSYRQAKPKLRELNEIVLSHLGSQDKEFWTKIERACHQDRQAMKMLEFLQHDLKDIKIQYLTFSEEYPAGPGSVVPAHFSKDFIRFRDGLLARIRMEEEYLFALLRASAHHG